MFEYFFKHIFLIEYTIENVKVKVTLFESVREKSIIEDHKNDYYNSTHTHTHTN